ncbi:MAG: hypothetical protein ACRYG5_07790 [Janthinobacterium lividum]
MATTNALPSAKKAPRAPKADAAKSALKKSTAAAAEGSAALPIDAPLAPAVRKRATRKSALAPAEALAAVVIVEEKPKRPKKAKVVRDSFTMPKADYLKIAALKQKCLAAGVQVKKSELLRAGLLLLEKVSEQRLLAVVASVETVKTGRPAKS